MNQDRWRSARELFDAALGVPAAERRALIEQRAAGDAELAAEALSLVSAHEAAGDFLAGTHVLEMLIGAAELAPEPRRERIGPWRLRDVLGRGGMGIVYLADREGAEFEQRAAIKVVSGGPDNPAIVERFRAERRILATLEHPGIARLLDGGTTDDGLPYFAMEYVEGEHLVAFAERQALDLRSRIELFLEVCAAVEHAHQRLVVHRDLKPGNILVGENGQPKLLDFGIARLLDLDPATASGATLTRGVWMTPAYASPEQIRGEPCTTAADIYSLGVVFYELLTGRSPYADAVGEGGRVTESAILEAVPPRPSTAASRPVDATASLKVDERARRARGLRGDLDTIVLKALAKTPERRYASVGELADDLRRHLAGRPVRARPDTLAYRTSRFVRRHRLGVAAAALAVMALLGGLALALLGFVRAQRAEAETRNEAEVSERVSEFLVDLFRINDPGEARGSAVTARELLDRGADRIEEQLAGQPAVRAKLLNAIGRAYGALGLFDPAAVALEKELAAKTGFYGAESAAAAETMAVLAKARMDRGEHAAARDLALRAVVIQERELGPESRELSYSLGQLGMAYWHLGELVAARPPLERALAIQEKTLEAEDPALGGTLNNLAILDWREGKLEDARKRYERALELFERVHGAEHPSVANTLSNLAILAKESGDPKRSRELDERALAVRRKLLAPDHPDIAETLNNLGDTLMVLGEAEAARRALEEALAIREKQLPADHPYVATTQFNLGLALAALGQPEAARRLQEKSLAAFIRSLGADHFYVSYPLSALAALDRREGRRERAEPLLRRALEVRTRAFGADNPETLALRADYAALLREMGRDSDAEALEKPG